jgi:hypothetical protein
MSGLKILTVLACTKLGWTQQESSHVYTRLDCLNEQNILFHLIYQERINTLIIYLFFSYLTGLIEGDGTIVVPKTERSKKGVLNYASVQIVFHLKDLPLALIIQKALGDGSIARKKGVNAYILTINSYKGLILIVPQQKIKRV